MPAQPPRWCAWGEAQSINARQRHGRVHGRTTWLQARQLDLHRPARPNAYDVIAAGSSSAASVSSGCDCQLGWRQQAHCRRLNGTAGPINSAPIGTV